jgi:UDP-GlcNAc:undecaprenyl-phosphate GlcNAc-1-phosphate transferase
MGSIRGCKMPYFLISLTASSLIMPIIIFLTRKFHIMDKPGGRKAHQKPIPLLGGLGIFAAFALSLLASADNITKAIHLIIYSAFIVAVGTVDDIWDIKAIQKLVLQTFCGLLAALTDIRFHIESFVLTDVPWMSVVDVLVSTAWMIGITNAVNITDGLDGLAGGIALIAGSAFAVISVIFGYTVLNQLSSILIGATLGFLIYNFYPAKLFMGDGGSLFLGFILSVCSIAYVNADRSSTSVLVSIIILALPIFETGSSMIRRALKGSSMIQADDGHIHYRLLKKGFKPASAVAVMHICAIITGILGVLIAVQNLLPLALFIIICLIALGIRLYI